jgi:hypothetical protein
MNNDGYISFDEWRYVYHPRSIAVLSVLCLPLGPFSFRLVTCSSSSLGDCCDAWHNRPNIHIYSVTLCEYF